MYVILVFEFFISLENRVIVIGLEVGWNEQMSDQTKKWDQSMKSLVVDLKRLEK